MSCEGQEVRIISKQYLTLNSGAARFRVSGCEKADLLKFQEVWGIIRLRWSLIIPVHPAEGTVSVSVKVSFRNLNYRICNPTVKVNKC